MNAWSSPLDASRIVRKGLLCVKGRGDEDEKKELHVAGVSLSRISSGSQRHLRGWLRKGEVL